MMKHEEFKKKQAKLNIQKHKRQQIYNQKLKQRLYVMHKIVSSLKNSCLLYQKQKEQLVNQAKVEKLHQLQLKKQQQNREQMRYYIITYFVFLENVVKR